jgi:hypothetical protein
VKSRRPSMAMADAEAEMPPCNPPGGADEEEDACRICHLPAEVERPLRYPCACRGTIRFVHDDCLLRWLATRRTSPSRCEVRNDSPIPAPQFFPSSLTSPPITCCGSTPTWRGEGRERRGGGASYPVYQSDRAFSSIVIIITA